MNKADINRVGLLLDSIKMNQYENIERIDKLKLIINDERKETFVVCKNSEVDSEHPTILKAENRADKLQQEDCYHTISILILLKKIQAQPSVKTNE